MFSLKNISKAIVWLVVRTIAFFVLVWIFIGMNPTETYRTIADRAMSLKNGTFSFSQSLSKTANSMKRVANHHLNEAAERTDGIDPYQRYNSTLDQKTRSGGTDLNKF